MSFVVISGHPGRAATADPGVQSPSEGRESGHSISERPLLAGSAADLHQFLSPKVCWGPDGQEAAGARLTLCLDNPPPQLFEIRPIWSRNAVKANISVHPDKLKVLLPFVAYYMVSACPASHLGTHQGRPDG